MDIDKLKEAVRKKYTNEEGLVDIGKYDHHLLDEIVTSTALQVEKATLENAIDKLIPIQEFFNGETDERCEDYRQHVLESLKKLTK